MWNVSESGDGFIFEYRNAGGTMLIMCWIIRQQFVMDIDPFNEI